MILASVKNTYNKYAGLSSETKPTDNIPMFSLFFEVDTGDTHYFDGSSWSKVGAGGGGGDEKSSDKVGTGQAGYMMLKS